MGEIEHFVDPNNKSHSKFYTIQDDILPLWTAPNQEVNGPIITNLTLKEALDQGIIANETLCYFMARSFKFLTLVGIKKEAIRYRQHRSNEMAHYATDCWDAEVETSYGWIEIAGHADRSCFDLSKHAEKTGIELVASRPLPEPLKVKYIHVTVDKKKMGTQFRKDSKPIVDQIEKWTDEEKEAVFKKMTENNEIQIQVGDNTFTLTSEYIKLEEKEKTIVEEKYVPHVIEPSFGIGRILYCVFEHCFKVREKDAQRTYFDFPALVAPIKCSLLPLMS